jgi:xylose isomerase
MTEGFFSDRQPIAFRSDAPDALLAYRHYDRERLVAGRRMEDLLRVAVCYWHTLNWSGADTFGEGTLDRPFLNGDPVAGALRKADVAFELLRKLGVRYYTFHDRDVAPEGRTLRESNANLDRVVERLHALQEQTGIRPLWGTANLFGNPRYMAGAATNPDPEVFAYAAAQVRKALDVTKSLSGENYVLWGGREGYDTLLNTDMAREFDQLARFLHLVADYKHKIGFHGALLIEPKPKEPTKHQYDFDAATVHAFLLAHGLEKEFKLNLARAVLIAERIVADGKLQGFVDERYGGWRAPLGRHIVEGASLEDLSDIVATRNLEPSPRSGRQEMLENLVQRYA